MTTHTDRIKQMAQEADEMAAAALGVGTYERWSDEFASKRDAAFAQLVAEDCARVAYGKVAEGLAHNAHVEIRARYSLKDE